MTTACANTFWVAALLVLLTLVPALFMPRKHEDIHVGEDEEHAAGAAAPRRLTALSARRRIDGREDRCPACAGIASGLDKWWLILHSSVVRVRPHRRGVPHFVVSSLRADRLRDNGLDPRG